ncbi:hypothetical protein FI667_g9944, partial [Globisporangium splendens]
MTFTYGAPDPYDTDLHALGGVWQQAMIATARREELKRQQQQDQPRPVYQRYQPRTGPPQFARGPVLWNPAAAPLVPPASRVQVPTSAAPTSATETKATPVYSTLSSSQDCRRPESEGKSAAGYVAPSIHTILDIAQSSRGYKVSRHDSPDRPSNESAGAGVIIGVLPRSSSKAASPPPRIGTFDSGTRASSPPSPTHGLPSALTKKPLRRGKWTKAEEVYAAATIQYFCSGLLNLQFGTLLRGFLAQQLHCHPMRISKKLLPGTRFHGVEITRKLGRRAYSPRWCDSPQATHEKLEAEEHLSVLQAKFVASLEEEEEGEDADGAIVSKDGEALSDRASELSDDRDGKPRRELSPKLKLDRVVEEENKENWSAVRSAGHSPPVHAAYHPQLQGVGQKRSREEWSMQQQHERRYASPPQQERRLHEQQMYHRADPRYYNPAHAHTMTPEGGRHEPQHPPRYELPRSTRGSPTWQHQQSSHPATAYHDDRRGSSRSSPSGPHYYPEQVRYSPGVPAGRYSYSESPHERVVRAPAPPQTPVLPSLPSLRESLGRNANTRL